MVKNRRRKKNEKQLKNGLKWLNTVESCRIKKMPKTVKNVLKWLKVVKNKTKRQ